MASVASFVDASGARLAVYAHGTAGEPILLLHGGPGVPDYLEDLAEVLATRHRVVRFDQRGTGRSTCPSGLYRLIDYAEDVEAVRRSWRIERLALFGHSWGGTVAQLYAARHPECVTRMCLSNSGIGLGADWRLMERAVMAHNRRRSGVAGFVLLGFEQLLALLPGDAGDRAARRMMARVWRNYFDPPDSAPVPSPEWLAGVHSRPIFATRSAALAADADALPVIGSIPVLVVFGEHDIYGDTTQRLVARCPGARVVIIKGAGHVPWLQNRNAFLETVVPFFECEDPG